MRIFCSKCKKNKRHGLDRGWKKPSSWCKECIREYDAAYRTANIEKLRRYRNKYQSTVYREKKAAYDKQYRKENPEKVRKWSREWNQAQRLEVLKAYGAVCKCCQETRVEFLGIDHINGGGQKHRKSLTVTIFRWLKKHSYPEGFRVLCHNCNMSLGFYGYCPHTKETKNVSE